MVGRAVVCEALGDPTLALGAGVMRLDPKWPSQQLKKGHIRIRVVAASVNYADPLCVKGEYQVKLSLPFVPGSEASGVVTEVGPGVLGFRPGDKVVAFNQGGCFADELTVHQSTAWHVPEGVDLATAAAVPVTYGTADVALRHRAGLQRGQAVLVLGAGGGVGVAAVQVAKAVGAHVIAVTQGPGKVAFLQQQGADVVIDAAAAAGGGGGGGAKAVPLSRIIKQHAPQGVHVVLDPVGGAFASEALKCLCAWGGHYLVIGFAAGAPPKVPANILLVKNATVHGVWWGSYLQHQPQVLQRSMDDIMTWLKQGVLTPQVSHRYPLHQVPDAFKAIMHSQARGKILIDVAPVEEAEKAAAAGRLAKL